jgi:hypothetical protein
MFHMDVAKADRNVAYVVMTIYTCCKSLFKIFIFRQKLQFCLSGCCICFTHILQVSYLDDAYALQWLLSIFQLFFQVF